MSDSDLIEEIAINFYTFREDYEDLDDFLGVVSKKTSLEWEWLNENEDKIHFHASFNEFIFTKEIADIYENFKEVGEQDLEDFVESYSLEPGLFRSLIEA